MSIQSVHVNPMPAPMPAHVRPQGCEGPGEARGGVLGALHGTRTRAASAAGRSAETIPTDAPAGTDPMLWSVLTSEERSFFARAHSMGQVTYGPGTRTARAGLPLGGRVDVRV